MAFRRRGSQWDSRRSKRPRSRSPRRRSTSRTGITARIAESPYLTCFPESLDPPRFPVSRFRAPATQTAAQPRTDRWIEDDGPLVYVSFGSVAAATPFAAVVYAKALDAVSALPVRVLLTTGGNDLELGVVPANVQVERLVDEADVLAYASVAVGHGGAGTTLSALAAGCPLVVVPLFGDQPTNAVRVAAAGAGVVATVDGIRASLEIVLRNGSYRETAERISAEMRSLPPVDGFLDALTVRSG